MAKLTVGAVALIIGLAGGLLIAGARKQGKTATTPASTERTDGPIAKTTGGPAETVEALNQAIARQSEEIRGLKEKVAQLEAKPVQGPAAKTGADKLKRAKEIYELFLSATNNKEGPEMVKAIGAIDELEEEMAPYFIEKLKAGVEDEELKHMLLFLTLMCGGKDVGAYVVERLGDASMNAEERQELLHGLAGMGGPVTKKLPLDEGLARLADRLIVSNDENERMGGAGLLGGGSTDTARVTLRRMAESDPSTQVRAAAIGSLGWNGDRTTLAWLEAYPKPGADDPQGFWIKRSLEGAIAQLKKRFPE